MRHETQTRLAQQILDYLDTGTTSMSAALYRQAVLDYIRQDRAAREREVLFRGRPLLLGLACELRESGDYLTDDFGPLPLLLVRNVEGGVNGLVNVCRHRGARVASGRGRAAQRFSCPYHAWSYHLDGTLMSIPFRDGFAGLDSGCHGLSCVPLAERHGMVWALPNPGFDLDEYLAGLGDDLAGFSLDTYSHYETRELSAPLNWKLVIDTFLETYHLSVLHRQTIAPILHSNLATFDAFGPHLRMVAARKTIETLRTRARAEWNLIPHSAIVYVIFPNTVLIVQGDHLETWRVYPGDMPNESRMYVSLYTPEPAQTNSAKAYWDRNMDLLMATVRNEDFPLAANIQRDFARGAQTHITFGMHEPALAHFHRGIDTALANDVTVSP